MNPERLLTTFLDLVQCDNPSGKETPVITYLRKALAALNLTVEQDKVSNLLIRLPGEGEPLLLNAHTDCVNPCINVRPVVAEGIIRSNGDTVLGADDLAGVAAILEALRSVLEAQKPHRAAEILFTTQEEIGLKGAFAFDYTKLRAKKGFTFDSTGKLGGICLGSPSQTNFHALIQGQAAHAGVAPEQGISAIQVAAAAINAMDLGRLDFETTANIGLIRGGEATNIVPPHVELWGEARSHDPQKLAQQVAAMEKALQQAAAAYGAKATIKFTASYESYQLSEEEAVVQQAKAAFRALGIEPYTFLSGGGSDVNVFRRRGLQVVNLALGYTQIHSVNEQIAITDLEQIARLAEVFLSL